MSEQTETTKKPGLRKTRVGVVTSTKMDKTIVVEYVARVPHPKFKKIVKKSKKCKKSEKKISWTTPSAARSSRIWELVEVLTH